MDKPDILVLNVDDKEVPRYAKTRVLQAAGFQVIEADNGRRALELVATHQPAIVLLDVKLPDISGYEVCGMIKQAHPSTLVLQTSATFTTGEDRSRGLERGADAYLAQPIEPRELVANMRALVRIRQAEDRLRALNDTLEQRVVQRTQELLDANQRLHAEIEQRERAEQALVQAQKMEAMGQLTGGLAHDFNNLLTVIIGNLHLLSARESSEKAKRWADNALQASTRAAKLTEQLLAFSRTQKLITKATDVAPLIQGMDEILRQSLGGTVPVRFDIAPDLPPAMTDGNQLELAILNLAINARDAMPGGGGVAIGAELRRLDKPQDALAPGDYVVVSVADTGEGMTREVAARAFDPFFTTKPVGKGTGLGLSQVYGIARQSGGAATLETAPGQGTTVSLWLPVADTAVASLAETAEGGLEGLRVLVVDDEESVRDLVATVLRQLGAEVQEAAHGGIALGMLQQGQPPHLLVLDYAMPGLNGAEVAKRVAARLPDVRFLFISGHVDMSVVGQVVPGAKLLRKPFLPAELAAQVRGLIDGGR